MRIIRGRFRRRKLLSSPGAVTRPIPDRVKESLFEFLEEDLSGARVADIFAGTGTIGLEAISRGAHSAVFFERDRKAAELLRKNVAALGVEDQTLCWQTDVMRTSFRPKNAEGISPFDIVFFDPPYRMVSDIRPGMPLYKSLERLAREGVTSDDARLIFRTPNRAAFAVPDVWELEQTLDYSNMQVHWYRCRIECSSGDTPASPDLPETPGD